MKKKDSRSDFDKAFAGDTLYQVQNRMVAKAKTKKFTPEDFVNQAEAQYGGEIDFEEASPERLATLDLEEDDEPW